MDYGTLRWIKVAKGWWMGVALTVHLGIVQEVLYRLMMIMMAVHITNLIIISCHNNKCLILHLFQCKLCDKKFGYKISLQEHISSIHERSEVHSCDECGATYSRFRGLRRHLAAKHGKQLRKSKELPIQNQPNTDEKEAENVLMIKNTDGSVFLCN